MSTYSVFRTIPFSLGYVNGSKRFSSKAANQLLASQPKRVGIVGLPNVGKSTLFNALTATQSAEAANYPFCTIEPNVAMVEVNDPRLYTLAKLSKSNKVIPSQVQFYDIAGLVRGASKGQGLGNQFLANIREVSVILHVVRCFEEDSVVHVDEKIDPMSDVETIETELMLADISTLEKMAASKKPVKGASAEAAKRRGEMAQRALDSLNLGKPFILPDEGTDALDRLVYHQMGLLSSKPVIYVANVDETNADGNTLSAEVTQALQARAQELGLSDPCIEVVSSTLEAEIASMPDAESKNEYRREYGLPEDDSGLDRIIRASNQLLNVISYFTTGPEETRAWSIPAGVTAPVAAGKIHTDIEKHFIRAETIAYDDFVREGSEEACKRKGLMRSEGKEYIVQDGDVMLFRHGA